MTARYTGTVSFIDENNAEITAPGMGPHSCAPADLRRCGADRLGAVVEFEFGVLAGGNSGAVNLSRPGMPR